MSVNSCKHTFIDELSPESDVVPHREEEAEMSRELLRLSERPLHPYELDM